MPTKAPQQVPSQSERTLKMKEAFMTLHNQGLSIKEIAHKFNLASCTVYGCLQEIADQAGVPRDSLLQVPKGKHLTHERRFEPVQPVDLTEFQERFAATLADFDAMLKNTAQQITQNEVISAKVTEEELSW